MGRRRFDSTLCGGGLCPIYFVAIWYDYSLVPRTGAMVVDEGGGKLTWGVDFDSPSDFPILATFRQCLAILNRYATLTVHVLPNPRAL